MTYDTQGRRIIGPQSTWEGECKALRAENERLRANLRDSEDAVNWAVMTKNMATDEVKQLRARVAELEAALRRLIGVVAILPPECDEPGSAMAQARAALQQREGGE